MNKYVALMLGASIAAITASAAFAQQVEEVVVTAQKRSENLQDVPITVSAITADSVAKAGIRTASDLTTGVPGLNVQNNTGATIFFIRGVGTALGSPGLDSTIATFIDGVYIPSMFGSTFSLNNIERVEVLKGPQGTLYGRNATGGAINIITRTPTHDPHLQASVGYGDHDTFEGNVYATTGLTDNLAIDFAGFIHDQGEGFGRNAFNGRDVNKSKEEALRSKLVFDATDDTRFTLAADYSRTRTSWGDALRPIPASTLLNGQIGYSGGYYDTNTDAQPAIDIKQRGLSARVDHDMGQFHLVNIAAYRKQNYFLGIDADVTPIPILGAPLTVHDGQFTEELQLSYSGERLRFLVGAFYLQSYNKFSPFIIEGLAVSPLSQLIVNDRQFTESLAAFGQATYEVADDTNLTLGLRYTRDKRTMRADQSGRIGAAPAFALAPQTNSSSTFKKPSWRIALDHKFTPEMMGYASYSRGFKSGVYNLSSPTDPAVLPETLDAYEAGIKSSLFDHRLRLNGSVFYYDYKNIQLNLVRGTTTLLLNAASSKMYGLDVDFEAALTEALTVKGGAALIHDRYKRFVGAPFATPNPTPPFGNTIVAGDASGKRMINTPDFTANILAQYQTPMAGGELSTNISAVYNDGFFWSPDNVEKQKAYTLVNAQAIWTAPGGKYNFRVWSTNLTNKKYLTTVNVTAVGTYGAPAPGRMFGVSAGVNF